MSEKEEPTIEQLREAKALKPILEHVENIEPEKYDAALEILKKLWHLGLK